MQTTQPKKKLTVKPTKFELHQSSTNEVKQDNTATFEEYRVYSKEFVLNIIREAQLAVPLPEFEFLVKRTKIEVRAVLKPNYQQKVAQRSVFLRSNIGKNSTQKEHKLRNYPKTNDHERRVRSQSSNREEFEQMGKEYQKQQTPWGASPKRYQIAAEYTHSSQLRKNEGRN